MPLYLITHGSIGTRSGVKNLGDTIELAADEAKRMDPAGECLRLVESKPAPVIVPEPPPAPAEPSAPPATPAPKPPNPHAGKPAKKEKS